MKNKVQSICFTYYHQMIPYIDIIGYIGSFTLSLTYIPQIIDIYKTKSAKDLSYLMIIMLIIGYIVFLAYGILIMSIPLIVSISISLANCVHLLIIKSILQVRENNIVKVPTTA